MSVVTEDRCDCGAKRGEEHLPACHLDDKTPFFDAVANIAARREAALVMLAALKAVVRGDPYYAARAERAIAQAEAAGITLTSNSQE